jgi:gas vesicle protein
MNGKYERNGSGPLLIFLAGGLIGAGVAMLYAPLNGEATRKYIMLQTERGKRKALNVTEDLKARIGCLINEIKGTADNVIEDGLKLTKEKKTELLAAVEAGKKAMEEEKKRLEQLRLEEKES